MSDFYSDMQNVAAEILGEFKQGVIAYIGVTPGNGPAHNPGPSVEAAPVIVSGVARGVKAKYVDGTTIVATDLQMTMPGKGVAPAMNGFVTIDGVRHKIVHIDRKPSAGTVVAWTVIIRK